MLVPPVVIAQGTVSVDGWLHFASPWARAELSSELYLRGLLEVELDDDKSVAAFLSENGMVSLPWRSEGSEARRREAALGDLIPFEVVEARSRPMPGVSHVREAAMYLRVARALVRHWLAYERGEDTRAAWDGELPGLLNGVPTYDDEAWFYFSDALNWGLKSFHVRVEVEIPWLEKHGADPVIGKPQAGLYSALCLQLSNHISRGDVAVTCASETCGRPFVRQEGGARFGQHRTKGVMYCSTNCAKAQAQREYRRRQPKGETR